jgi:hypothetical protein
MLPLLLSPAAAAAALHFGIQVGQVVEALVLKYVALTP